MSSWSILVPVISTAHAPGPDALVNLCKNSVHAQAPDDPTLNDPILFVYVDEEWTWEGDEAWVQPIAEWMRENFKDCWVRFDHDGDVIPELPTYPDLWN